MTTPESPRPEPMPDGQAARAHGSPAHDVFVSYSTHDKPVADAIVARLEQAGIRCWVAPRDVIPGEVWGEAILRAIQSSRLMVVVLSGAANESRQVIREVERAVAGDVVVVPFRIDESEPTGAMAYFLASEHWLDALTPPMEAHIAQLVTVTRALLASRPPRTAAGTSAPSIPTPADAVAPAVPAPADIAAPAAPPSGPAPAPAPVTQRVATVAWGGGVQTPAPAAATGATPPTREASTSRMPLVAGAVVAVLVLVVGLSWAAGIGPFGAAATPTPAPTAAPTPTRAPTPPPTATPTPTPTPPVGSAEDVHLLTQLVSSGVRATCAAAPLAGRELAAVECAGPGAGRVRYDWYAGLGDLRADWRAFLDASGLTASTGSCTDDVRGEAAWWFGQTRERDEGRVACHTDPGGTAIFRWTDDAILVRVSFTGSGGASVASLREPWRSGDYDPDRLVAALLTGRESQPPLVPERFRPTCEAETVGVAGGAAVRCQPEEVDEVRYAVYDDREALDADWADLVEALALEPGDGGRCFEGEPGEASWNFGSDPDGTDRGRILCATVGDGAMLAWTDWDVLVQVVLHGARILDLHEVWADGALDPVKP